MAKKSMIARDVKLSLIHISVLRSVHVNKDSREQFEMRVHRRMIELLNSTDKAISSLTSVHLPAGVGIEIKQV